MENKKEKECDKKGLLLGYLGVFILTIYFCIKFSSALYSGETTSFAIDLDYYSNFTIIGNTSAIDVVVFNETTPIIVNVTIPEDYVAGSFIIRFYGFKNNQPEVITHSHGGSRKCTTYDTCSDWFCVNNISTRSCVSRDAKCKVTNKTETKSCEVIVLEPPKKEEENTTIIPTIQIEDRKGFNYWIPLSIFLFVILIAIVIIIIFLRSRAEDKVDEVEISPITLNTVEGEIEGENEPTN